MFAIETKKLVKDYGRIKAVKDLDLKVKEGSVYGFIGPNGAGKSTAINMLMGFVKPTSGSASILGLDAQAEHYEIMKMVGYLPERPAFYDGMSGVKNIEYFGKLLGVKDLDERSRSLLRLVGLEGRGGDRVKAYSHGMRQRLGIAIALLGNPKVLIMDEPATGLDPQGSHDVREVIKKLGKENVTIFLSSHILYEVQEVCDYVGIIKSGRLIVEKPMGEFLTSIKGNMSRIEITASRFDDAHIKAAKAVTGVESIDVRSDMLLADVTKPEVAEDLNIVLVGAGCRVRGIKEVMPSLEDAFLKVTAQEDIKTEGQ